MPFFAAIGKFVLFPFTYTKQVMIELKQVTWPSRKETISSTMIVILLSVIVGAWIGGLDFIFTKAIGVILK